MPCAASHKRSEFLETQPLLNKNRLALTVQAIASEVVCFSLELFQGCALGMY